MLQIKKVEAPSGDFSPGASHRKWLLCQFRQTPQSVFSRILRTPSKSFVPSENHHSGKHPFRDPPPPGMAMSCFLFQGLQVGFMSRLCQAILNAEHFRCKWGWEEQGASKQMGGTGSQSPMNPFIPVRDTWHLCENVQFLDTCEGHAKCLQSDRYISSLHFITRQRHICAGPGLFSLFPISQQAYCISHPPPLWQLLPHHQWLLRIQVCITLVLLKSASGEGIGEGVHSYYFKKDASFGDWSFGTLWNGNQYCWWLVPGIPMACCCVLFYEGLLIKAIVFVKKTFPLMFQGRRVR